VRKNNATGPALSFLFLSAVFLLALNKVADTDAWMHLALGRTEWLHRSASFHEPYSYPSFGKSYYNYSWLFSLAYYLAYRALDLYGVILLKAGTALAVFYVLLKDSLRPYRNYAVSIAVLMVIVIMVRPRFVERPDMFLMFFLAFCIFSLNAYVYDNRKYLYGLPLTHLIWANSHTSASLMVVPFLAFIAGGLFHRWGNRRGFSFKPVPSKSQLATITVVFLVSLAATLITPSLFMHSGNIGQFTAGPRLVLEQSWSTANIGELGRPVWPFNKWPFIMPGIILLSFIVNRRRLSVIHLLLMIPFIILPFTAKRFIFLLGVVSAPVIARNFSSLLDSLSQRAWSAGRLAAAGVALCVIVFTALSIGQAGPFADRKQTFGFGINDASVPEGALRYMDRMGISGRMFNLFDWGGYVNWRDYPMRSVFIDARAALPPEFREKADVDYAVQNPAVLDALQKRYGFETLLLPYPLLSKSSLLSDSFSDQDILVSSTDWKLVYWDDLALVYVRKGGAYDRGVADDAYRFVRPANFAPFSVAKLHDDNYRSSVELELLRNVRETGSSRAYAILGSFYSLTARWKEALGSYARVTDRPGIDFVNVLVGIGDAAAALGDYPAAIRHYREALRRNAESPPLIYKTGLAYAESGDARTGAAYLEKAAALNPAMASPGKILPGLYMKLGAHRPAEAAFVPGPNAVQAARFNLKGLAAYAAGRFDIALAVFEQAARLEPNNPAYYSNLGYVAFDTGMLEKAYDYQEMALANDPGYANAHYGLALILKKWGKTDLAREHWKQYLRTEPSGKFADRAREEINTTAGPAAR